MQKSCGSCKWFSKTIEQGALCEYHDFRVASDSTPCTKHKDKKYNRLQDNKAVIKIKALFA